MLHHTPETGKAIQEVHRVLRPGGRAMVMLYHRGSYNYRVNISLLRRAGAQLLRWETGIKLVHRDHGRAAGVAARTREASEIGKGILS